LTVKGLRGRTTRQGGNCRFSKLNKYCMCCIISCHLNMFCLFLNFLVFHQCSVIGLGDAATWGYGPVAHERLQTLYLKKKTERHCSYVHFLCFKLLLQIKENTVLSGHNSHRQEVTKTSLDLIIPGSKSLAHAGHCTHAVLRSVHRVRGPWREERVLLHEALLLYAPERVEHLPDRRPHRAVLLQAPERQLGDHGHRRLV
jgi:hypothetical protein